jgi:hypothetical protein
MGLEADGICKIIRECKKSGVRSLQLGELSVSFEADRAEQPSPWVPMDPSALQERRDAQSLLLDPAKEQQTMMTTQERGHVLEQYEDAQRLVNDPIGYEADIIADYMEMIRRGEATDGA